MGRVGVCMLCVCDSEQRERGVGVRVNATIQSETLYFVGVAKAATRAVRLRKKTMNLCVCDSEQRERGVGVRVNTTILSETL